MPNPASGRPDEDAGPLYSPLASDAGLVDLVETFVETLPERGEALRKAHDAGDLDELRSLAHSLKGAAGSYGFLPITDACAALELRIRESEPIAIRAAIHTVVELCERATSRPAP